MPWDAPDTLLIISAFGGMLVSVIAAISGAIFAYRNGAKADTIIDKTVEIHTLTNSHLTEVTSALVVAQTKIDGLEKLIASLVSQKVTADKLAENQIAKTVTPLT